MTWEFKVGQKVVCVNASALPGEPGGIWGQTEAPIEGDIYTVSRVYLNRDGQVDFWLEEISRDAAALDQYDFDAGYASERFRPLVTDTQSWLKEILENPPPAPVKIPIMHPDFTTEYVEIGDGWGMR